MRELSLFTGAGGGLLGTRLLGWRPVGYVEWADYCQRVLRARIDDGHLEEAPIYGDLRAFNGEGYAAAYRGMVDVITAGFPCQPFSLSGRKLAGDDERNMWPATAECIRIVRPRFALLENVPGLVSCGYIGTVLGDLAAMGYDARWGVFGADSVGAPHRRERLWIVANANGERLQGQGPLGQRINSAPDCYREASGLVNAFRGRALPYVCRVHDGVADGLDRLKAIGNGQVPAMAALAWLTLLEPA
jgi:DNA (cytosine-5)-methyltransferase 1